jgi:tetratricopeptide (TPR) repeat protein
MWRGSGHAGKHAEAVTPDEQAKLTELKKTLKRLETLEKLGKFKEGLALATQAVSQATELGHAAALAEALYCKGSLQENSGDYTGAEETLLVASSKAATVKDPLLYARATCKLAWVLCARQGRFDEALAMMRVVEDYILPNVTDPMALSDCLHVKQHALLNKGQLDAALSTQKQIVEIRERSFGRDDPSVAKALYTLAVAQVEHGDLKDAEANLERAVTIIRTAFGPGHFIIGSALNLLGLIATKQGNNEKAQKLFDEAVRIDSASVGAQHPYVADHLLTLGNALIDQGKVGESCEVFERALAIIKKIPTTSDAGASAAYLGLGECSLSKRRFREASIYFEQSLAGSPRGPRDDEQVARARFGLARALHAQGKDSDRTLRLARSARDYYASKKDSASKQKLDNVDRWIDNPDGQAVTP